MIRIRNRFPMIAAASLLLFQDAAAQILHSDLWGADGERWNPRGRLPDFSHAGYRYGESPLPDLPVKANVKAFGAVGDGKKDDTQAFQDALSQTTGGAILVPEGKYLIQDFLYIRKSGVVLRGEGPGKSVLWFPKPLNDIVPREGRTSTGTLTTAYSFNYGFLTLEGKTGSRELARVTATALRGDSAVEVSSVANLKVGQQVILEAAEDRATHSLKRHLYADDPGDVSNGKNLATRMVARISAIKGGIVGLDRPLRFETRSEWNPRLLAFEPTVTESGVEELGFIFPDVPYPGHFKEVGFNAIELRGVAHCWVRNVAIRNADMGVLTVDEATFNTVAGVAITAYAGRGRFGGHHAIQLKTSQDNLVTGFDIGVPFVHDLSVEHASGNVFSGGRGSNLSFDHHKDTPYENLYTDLDCGIGDRIWVSGGGAGIGRHAAAWATFWNVRAGKDMAPPPAEFGPWLMNVIALRTAAPSVKDSGKVWLENIAPEAIRPADLHAAQIVKRLARPGRINKAVEKGRKPLNGALPHPSGAAAGRYYRIPHDEGVITPWSDAAGKRL